MIRKAIVKTKRKKVKPETTRSAGLIPVEVIERRIFTLRGHRVMLDHDLAKLYGVLLKRLNEQVKRNRDRFPEALRAFVRLRRMLAWSNRIAKKVEALERRVGENDADVQDILRTLRKLIEPPPLAPKRPIGFLSGLPARRIQRNASAALPAANLKKSRGAGAT